METSWKQRPTRIIVPKFRSSTICLELSAATDLARLACKITHKVEAAVNVLLYKLKHTKKNYSAIKDGRKVGLVLSFFKNRSRLFDVVLCKFAQFSGVGKTLRTRQRAKYNKRWGRHVILVSSWSFFRDMFVSFRYATCLWTCVTVPWDCNEISWLQSGFGDLSNFGERKCGSRRYCVLV